MKNLKKLFATMLCLVTVLCTTATAFAAEAQPESATASDPVVAEVTIFSTTGPDDGSSINTSGHSWIAVKNISSSTIGVGKMNVGPGLEITLGTWGNINQHRGMWYNIESYAANHGAYSGRASLTTTITQSKLDLLNVAIVYTNGWSLGAPCSSAAAKLWNTVSDIRLSNGTPSTPTSLRQSIMSKSGYQLNRSIQYTTPIGYVNLAANFVTVAYSDLDWNPNVSLGIGDIPE